MCTTVPTSPAVSPSSGTSSVSTTMSCSLIIALPPKDRPLSAEAQSVHRRLATHSGCAAAGRQELSIRHRFHNADPRVSVVFYLLRDAVRVHVGHSRKLPNL